MQHTDEQRKEPDGELWRQQSSICIGPSCRTEKWLCKSLMEVYHKTRAPGLERPSVEHVLKNKWLCEEILNCSVPNSKKIKQDFETLHFIRLNYIKYVLNIILSSSLSVPKPFNPMSFSRSCFPNSAFDTSAAACARPHRLQAASVEERKLPAVAAACVRGVAIGFGLRAGAKQRKPRRPWQQR